MKIGLITYMILISVLTFGQSETYNDTIIFNEISDKHTFIPGTRAALIPPSGFTIAKQFRGFENKNAMIQIVDLSEGNFYSNAKNFTEKAWRMKGAIVLDYKELTLNNYPTKYVHLRGNTSLKNIALVFGDTTFSIMIMGYYPANNASLGREIIKSIMTVVYDKSRKVDPFENTPFKLDDENTNLKFHKYDANMYLFKKENQSEKDSTMFIVGPVPFDESIDIKEQVLATIIKFQKKGFELTKTIGSTSKSLNSYDSYSTVVEGTLKNREITLFVQMVVNGDIGLIIQGTCPKGSKKDLNNIRELIKTIEFIE